MPLRMESRTALIFVASPYECGNKVRSRLRMKSAALDELPAVSRTHRSQITKRQRAHHKDTKNTEKKNTPSVLCFLPFVPSVSLW